MTLGLISEALNEGLGPRQLLGSRRPDFGDQLVEVASALFVQFKPSNLGANRFLEQLGGGETALLDLSVEIIGEIDLHPCHAHIYTPLVVAVQGPS